MAAALRPTAPPTAVDKPYDRLKTRKSRAAKLTNTTIGRIMDQPPEVSALRAIATKLKAIAVRNRLPSRTRSRSSSSNGRTLRGSEIV